VWYGNRPDFIDIPARGTHTEAFHIFDFVPDSWTEWRWRHDDKCKDPVTPTGRIMIQGHFIQVVDEFAERHAEGSSLIWSGREEDRAVIEHRKKQAWSGSLKSNIMSIDVGCD